MKTPLPMSAVLSNLTSVGPRKPVGYLPLYTLREVAHVNPKTIAASAAACGLEAKLFGPDECCIRSGAIYVYDRAALAHVLAMRAEVLSAEQLSLDPDRFVAHMAATWFESNHPIYPVICAAFGDIG